MPASEESPATAAAPYRDDYVRAPFDRMGPTYDAVNQLSSFGFSSLWRRVCVRNADPRPDDCVCDMMAGSGECWPFVPRSCSEIVSIDFCPTMVRRQHERRERSRLPIEIREENALRTSLDDSSVDCAVSAFGLKTLDREATAGFARELHRMLKPGGRFSLLEISTAEGWWLAPLCRWYIRTVIPLIEKICLGDIDCYRKLGSYTEAFGSCHGAAFTFFRLRHLPRRLQASRAGLS